MTDVTWYCEACRVTDVCAIAAAPDVFSVVKAIGEQHAQRSPACTVPVTALRVLSPFKACDARLVN